MELNKYLDQSYGQETREYRKAGGMVLSPSSISKFFDNAHEWWLDRNGIVTFDGSTATVLGNAIHAAIDAFYDGETISEEEVKEWIETRYAKQMDTVAGYSKATKTKASQPIPKVDRDVVLANYMPMFEAWKNEYASMYPAPDMKERPVEMVMDDKIKVAGKFDAYEAERKVLIDYKTTGKMPSKMSSAHKFQLSTYAMALIAEGIDVEAIRTVYIVRPTQKLPARIAIFDEELTDKMLMEQVRVAENMKRSILAVQDNPELTDLIFRENLLSMWN